MSGSGFQKDEKMFFGKDLVIRILCNKLNSLQFALAFIFNE